MTGYIVHIDDDEFSRQVFKHFLEKGTGLKTISFETAADALTFLKESTHRRDIVGICTDLMMQGMDGIQFIVEVKSIRKWRYTPLLVLSGVSNNLYKNLLRKLGVRRFLKKPLHSRDALLLGKYLQRFKPIAIRA